MQVCKLKVINEQKELQEYPEVQKRLFQTMGFSESENFVSSYFIIIGKCTHNSPENNVWPIVSEGEQNRWF